MKVIGALVLIWRKQVIKWLVLIRMIDLARACLYMYNNTDVTVVCACVCLEYLRRWNRHLNLKTQRIFSHSTGHCGINESVPLWQANVCVCVCVKWTIDFCYWVSIWRVFFAQVRVCVQTIFFLHGIKWCDVYENWHCYVCMHLSIQMISALLRDFTCTFSQMRVNYGNMSVYVLELDIWISKLNEFFCTES